MKETFSIFRLSLLHHQHITVTQCHQPQTECFYLQQQCRNGQCYHHLCKMIKWIIPKKQVTWMQLKILYLGLCSNIDRNRSSDLNTMTAVIDDTVTRRIAVITIIIKDALIFTDLDMTIIKNKEDQGEKRKRKKRNLCLDRREKKIF